MSKEETLIDVNHFPRPLQALILDYALDRILVVRLWLLETKKDNQWPNLLACHVQGHLLLSYQRTARGINRLYRAISSRVGPSRQEYVSFWGLPDCHFHSLSSSKWIPTQLRASDASTPLAHQSAYLREARILYAEFPKALYRKSVKHRQVYRFQSRR